jgi:glycosyltransferase involved in cell wall biosynthesis
MLVTPRLPEPELIEGFIRGKVSIIMPAYNELDCIARSVADTKNRFRAVCPDYEIIVVDDGSVDGTRDVIENLKAERVKIVGYERNQGKGHALKVGLYSATGQFAFMVDSDLEIHATELESYVKALDSADIVIGSKRHRLSSVKTPPIRRFLSLGFNILERLLTGVRATDTQAGIKAARSAALYRILPLLSVKKYAFDAELLTVASLLNYRIVELPVTIQLGATFSMRQVFRMLIDLVGISYRLRVRHWYQKNNELMTDTYKPIIPW